MAKRKKRIVVLLDTSVLVNAWANPRGKSASAIVWQLWLGREIQFAVSALVVGEYFAVLERLGYSAKRIQEFSERLATRRTVTWVNLGRRLEFERDIKDEPILSTAHSAQVEYLITLDRDMLEMPLAQHRRFKFEIVTPAQFLERIA
ncbi:MAG: hypothetical protein BroJett039_03090 [Chloroflexota bacterium]|nr:MAG: hypothetical protein BroJett039_03090 [Chloroflexota bacterium]